MNKEKVHLLSSWECDNRRQPFTYNSSKRFVVMDNHKWSHSSPERSRYEAMDLNLRSLSLFVLVAESGGVSQAARYLGLTQSAVSQSIAGLEHFLGVQLFDREVRPMALTPSGGVLCEKARGLLNAAREAVQAVRKPAASPLPKLKISVQGVIAGAIGLGLVNKIEGLAAQWSIQKGVPGYNPNSLLTRETDVVISADFHEDQPNLERYLILKEQLILVVPASQQENCEDLQALARTQDLVRLNPSLMLGRHAERHLRRLGVEPASRFEFDEQKVVMDAVAHHLGWSITTPLSTLFGQHLWPKLKFLPLPGPAASLEIYVIARKKELGDIPKMIAEFAIELLSNVFNETILPSYPWMRGLCDLPKIASNAALRADAQPSASSAPQSPSPGLIPSDKLARSA